MEEETCTSASQKVKQDDMYEIEIPELEEGNPTPENIELDIVFEDDDIIVINKPAGMVVHPGAGNYTGTLVNALMHHCKDSLSGINGEKRPGIPRCRKPACSRRRRWRSRLPDNIRRRRRAARSP